MKKQKPQKNNVTSIEDFVERKTKYFATVDSTAGSIMKKLEFYLDKLTHIRRWKKQLFPEISQQNKTFRVEDFAH
ncbi:MAG TPA: hypothetical protein VE971_02160 [Candidatus Eisenbacteria bacterium]|nr:hypothetical protein [Candidatus Eisenbacteria bacterium]